MRICIIGDINGNLDEGMKNVAFNLNEQIKKDNDTQIYNPKEVIKPKTWIKIRKFNPKIIHYIAGPTIISFLITFMLKKLCNNTTTIISMIHPKYMVSDHLTLLLKPDLLLSQTKKTEEKYKKLGFNVKFLPNGVNLNRYQPVSDEKKKELRKKFGISPDKFVLLHVGNFRKGRNLTTLKQLKDDETEILIVGSTTISDDDGVIKNLKKSYFTIMNYYIPQIEEIYSLADCYVFPTLNDANCIETPLSIMEAMSCNLPVVTTKFGAISRLFNSGEGLFIVKNIEELIFNVNYLKNANLEIKTRNKVFRYSWENIGNDLNLIYNEIKNQDKVV